MQLVRKFNWSKTKPPQLLKQWGLNSHTFSWEKVVRLFFPPALPQSSLLHCTLAWEFSSSWFLLQPLLSQSRPWEESHYIDVRQEMKWQGEFKAHLGSPIYLTPPDYFSWIMESIWGKISSSSEDKIVKHFSLLLLSQWHAYQMQLICFGHWSANCSWLFMAVERCPMKTFQSRFPHLYSLLAQALSFH